MSKMKRALEVVDDLRSLANSIEGFINDFSKDKADEMRDNPKVDEADKSKEERKEKQPSLEEVRAAMADKNRDGHRDAVKAILLKYGANKLTALDPSCYMQVLKEVGDIK